MIIDKKIIADNTILYYMCVCVTTYCTVQEARVQTQCKNQVNWCCGFNHVQEMKWAELESDRLAMLQQQLLQLH